MRYQFLLAGFLATGFASGQNAVGWATGIAEKFATISNTVVSTYSLGQLAILTCDYDQSAASIDAGENRISYELAVPGLTIFTLPGALKQAQAIDPQQLESLIASVRDDAKQAEAYLAIAELRFKKGE